MPAQPRTPRARLTRSAPPSSSTRITETLIKHGHRYRLPRLVESLAAAFVVAGIIAVMTAFVVRDAGGQVGRASGIAYGATFVIVFLVTLWGRPARHRSSSRRRRSR